jgi:protein-glutamine gamma-glutamyltransferase
MTVLRTPPLLLGAALLFWGWQSGLFLVSALLAVVLESSRVVGLRWELSEKDFRRLWDFCTLLFVTVGVFLFASGEGPQAILGLFANASPASQNYMMQQTAQALMVLFRCLPMILFLFVAAHAYSTWESIPHSVYSLLLRRRLAGTKAPTPARTGGVNPAYPYFAVCLFSSSISVRSDRWFFAGQALLLAWALWSQRSRRYGAAVWVGLLGLTLATGFYTQRGFFEAANWANARGVFWLAQFFRSSTDPRETRTAIGQTGRLKLSGRIVLRVEPKDHQAVPTLLREASYRFFKYPDWAGTGKMRDLEPAQSETNLTTWELAPGQPAQGAVRISQYLTGRGTDARRGLLALPQGIVRIENLNAFQVSTNQLGVVRVDEGPGLVSYDAYHRDGSTLDAPPDGDDLALPHNEDALLTDLVSQLQLSGLSTSEILKQVAGFFRDRFQYSTALPASHVRQRHLTPLASFLTRERAGHCEYFATAAALLLRKANVPARYAVGYAVQERSGRQFVVRERHAHAWCLVWMDNAWHDFDVTPGSWREEEASRASMLEWLSDAWSRLWFEFSRWRWGQSHWRTYAAWGLIPVLLGLLGRLFFGKQWKRFRQEQKRKAAAARWPGSDSEFYRLQATLGRLGRPRNPGESLVDWLQHLSNHPLLAAQREALDRVLRLHYRYRFDPAGLGTAEREELRAQVRTCLELVEAKHYGPGVASR